MGQHAKSKVKLMEILSRGNALSYRDVNQFKSWQLPSDEHGESGSFRLGMFYAP